MATYALRRLDPDTITRAKARAHDAGTSLDAVLREYLTTYAGGDRGVAGGHARAAALSATQRRESAQRAARARWDQHTESH